ncbi:MAG: P63C domain-containing protein [Candidatus Nitrotoga sp.]|nr:P63C domain-containing protein [Candidatus Nitrotoga sp.]
MENEIKGRAKGGKVKNALMTPEARKEQSKKMVIAKKEKALLPKSAYRGEIQIGDMTIPCCVLEDGRRLISENGITGILGTTGGKSYRLRDSVAADGVGPMPLFLASKALQPFIGEAFDGMDLSIVEYVDGNKISSGYDAKILPKVCEVWLRAKDKGALQDSQLVKAKKAEILMRGLAYIGIIALVDEVTGYQYERPRRELEEQLERFISESLRRWVNTFPPDYFKHLCRLRGVTFRPDMKLPQYFGNLTNNIVYKRLAPGLLKRLKEKRNEIGKPSNKLHSWLSLDTGFPEVLFHLGAVVDKMKRHTSYEDFEKELNETMPIYPENPGLFDDPKDWEER